ncbi:hypothetical protein AB1Y20_011718 [Prymnesium parvum]|uniref:1-phosphatidylinositol-3-phosphate 5-kinase n=1 Tax=Prymnesium parvum TaxID=97485 RepID=A0AB34IHB7_PRYPA
MAHADNNLWTWTVGNFGRASPAPRASPPPPPPLTRAESTVHTELLAACTLGHLDDARRLLDACADANGRAEFGTTPLMRAAEQGHAALAGLLLSRGAQLGCQDDNGDCALLCACRMGHADVARLLLAAGADAGLSNKQGNNSLDAALEARDALGRPAASELLLGHRRGDASSPAEKEEGAAIRSQPAHASVSSLNGVPRSGTGLSLTSEASLVSARVTPHAPVLRLSREQWANDRNYPQCHLCKSTFTIWNRRHHCRICGLVFCERCSSSSVSTPVVPSGAAEGEGDAASGAPAVLRVRVCTSCAQIHAAQPNGPLMLDERGPIETREVAVGLATNIAERMRSVAMPALSRVSSAMNQVRYGSGADPQRPRLLSVHSEEIEDASFSNPNSGKSDSGIMSRDIPPVYEGDAAPQSEDTLIDVPWASSRYRSHDFAQSDARVPIESPPEVSISSSFDGSLEGRGGVRTSLKALASSRLYHAISGRKSLTPPPAAAQEEGGRPRCGACEESGEGTRRAVEEAEGGQPVRLPPPPSSVPPPGAGHRRGSSAGSAMIVQEKILQLGNAKHREKPLARAPPVTVPTLANEPEAVVKEHRTRLAQWRQQQLRCAVQSQLRRHPGLSSQWQGTLEVLATRAADSLLPDVNYSVDSILKIKTLPGGSRADAHYVDGLVCRMKLAHKCMRTELEYPRILLLACPLEHERRSFSSSLEALRQQEDEHMGMIVNEMAKLEIDLLLVGGSVCFTAKEKLLKRGIALAVGVKPSVLQRVARCCKTQVLLSPAQVLGTAPGTCGRWRVENVTVADPEAAANKRVTLMYFERCAPELGATVVLRGGTGTELKKLKQVLASSAYIAADLATEASYIFDFGGTVPLTAMAGGRSRAGSEEQAATRDHPEDRARAAPREAADEGGGGGRTRVGGSVSGGTSPTRPRGAPQTLSVEMVLGGRGVRRGGVPWQLHPPELSVRPSVDVEGADAAGGAAEGESQADPASSFSSAPPFAAAHASGAARSCASSLGRSRENTVGGEAHDSTCGARREAEESFLVGDANFGLMSCAPKCNDEMEDEKMEADRLWTLDARTIRVATCWKRWDVPEAPCQVPRERTLFYDLKVADVAQSASSTVSQEDYQTLGQFLQSHCFNLSRQCKNPKCREGVLRHEQCFSHHGGRFSLRVQQMPADHSLPHDGVFTWSVCQACPAPTRSGPVLALSAATCAISLGRFLESNFYNTSAISRAPGCTHSLHRHHERFISCGGLVCSLKFQKCTVFSVTPPIAPQILTMQSILASTAAANFALGREQKRIADRRYSKFAGVLPFKQSSGSGAELGATDEVGFIAGPSAVAAHALGSSVVQAEVSRVAGPSDLTQVTSHDKLAEIMRSEAAQTKIEIKYEGDAEREAEAARACPGLILQRVSVLFPAPFAALRQRFCEGGDIAFVKSLWQSSPWDSGRGGKSGSTFLKTLDGRYLLKQVPKSEFSSFHEHARAYFAFVSNTPTTLPSVLVKVMGAFMVEYRERDSNKQHLQYLLVQENLFYGMNVSRMCDLKGAQRKASPNPNGEDDNDTVLDENLFRFNDGYPLLLSEVAKQQLTRALWNDTLFLQSINVMDYSLLVGMVQRAKETEDDPASNESWTLVVGLIDYCRQYTWKEEAESRVKRGTVIQPKQYKRRFREALHRYFMSSIEKYQAACHERNQALSSAS